MKKKNVTCKLKSLFLTIAAALLVMTMASTSVGAAEVNGDVNLDGEIAIDDLVLLAQYLAGWDVSICKHTNTEIKEAKEPTCTEMGLTEGKICLDCEKILLEQTVIPANGHSWDYTLNKCTVCDEPFIATDGLEFAPINDGTEYEVYGIGTVTEDYIVVPGNYNGKPVTQIGELAFDSCNIIKTVKLPDSIVKIGNSAFKGSSLQYIEIPDSVQEIGIEAFKQSGIKEITIPNGITSIGASAFYYCVSLESVNIPDSVTSIGDAAFYCCDSLESVNIPDSVTSIGDRAFYYCYSLESVTIGKGLTRIGSEVFRSCSKLTSIIIPENVTSIASSAFSYSGAVNKEKGIGYVDKWIVECDTSVTSVRLRTDTVGIADSAFSSCSTLESVTIPNSVTSIGNGAFYECSSLTSVAIPESVTSIGAYAFRSCTSLTSVTIPNSVTSIGEGAFYKCSLLTSVAIPESVTSIGYSAFYECSSLTSVTIPNSVTSIGDDAFVGTKVIEEENNIYYVGKWVVGSVYYPSTVTFRNDTVGIARNALDGRFTSVTIPYHIKHITPGAFTSCSSLATINVASNNPNYCSVNGVLFSKDKNTLITYPQAKTETEYEIPSSVSHIADYAFYSCDNIKSISIPESVNTIGVYAFEYCNNLIKIQYSGTLAEWKAIEKSRLYRNDYSIGNFAVYCTDGTLSKSEA